MHLNSRTGLVDMTWLLIEHGAGAVQSNEFTTSGVRRGSYKSVTAPNRKHSTDVATQDKNGTTPLHRASEGSHVDLPRLLIKHGADTAAQSKDGTTLPHRASEGRVMLIWHSSSSSTAPTSTGRLRSIGRPHKVRWIWLGSSLSTALTQQPRARMGRHR